MPRGRKSTYSQRRAMAICDRIANGEPLVRICGPDRKDGVPSRFTVYAWLQRHEDFMSAYLLARRAQADLLMAEMLEIADGRDAEGEEGRDVRRDKLRIDTRWRLISLMAPKFLAERMARGVEADTIPEHDFDDDPDGPAIRIAALLEDARRRGVALGVNFDDEDDL